MDEVTRIDDKTLAVKKDGVTEVAKVSKAEGQLKLSSVSGTYTYPTGGTFTVSSGVGYYADVDGNGTVEGVIFEDFKVGGSGSWDKQSYTIPTVSNTKSYRVSQKNYSGPFGTKDVLAPIGSGNDRFYVMALNDYSGSTITFTNAQNIKSGKWKTPTLNSWLAFASQLGITTKNYSGYGFKWAYWTTTAVYEDYGCYIDLQSGAVVKDGSTNFGRYVRLAVTF